MKIIKASFLSIFFMVLITALTFWFFGEGNDLQLAGVFGATIASSTVATIVLIFYGVPVHLLLVKLNNTKLALYMIYGFIPGPFFVFIFKPFGFDEHKYLVLQSLFCGAVGVIGASVFWFFSLNKKRSH